MSVRSKREEDSEATRRRIVTAAVKAFGEEGFAAANVETIARAASVTTGAIYHHFAGKAALFRAAAEAVEEEIVALVSARPRGEDPWTDLLDSIGRALDICMRPHIRQIAFIDAPNVIGASEWREIQSRYGLGILIAGLRELEDRKVVATGDVELAARMLLAALIEAAQACATSPHRGESLENAHATLTRFAESLRSPG